MSCPALRGGERDLALLGYEAFLCYIDDAGPAEGSSLMNGMGVLYPGQPLPLAWQGLKAWHENYLKDIALPSPLPRLSQDLQLSL